MGFLGVETIEGYHQTKNSTYIVSNFEKYRNTKFLILYNLHGIFFACKNTKI